MVRKFVAVRPKVVTLGYLGLYLQKIMFVGQPQDFTFKEFEVHILGKMNKDSHRALEAWISLEISIYDVGTNEFYPLNLSKKQSFWSKPTPFIDQSLRKERSFYPNATMMEQPACYDLEEAREEFPYLMSPLVLVFITNVQFGINYSQIVHL